MKSANIRLHNHYNNKGGEMKRNLFWSLVLLIAVFLMIFAFDKRMDQQGNIQCSVKTVVAHYGDTLWDIGYKYCGGDKVNMEEVRYQLVKLNGDVIQNGQKIILP